MNLKKLSLMSLSILCMSGCKQQANVLTEQYTKGIGIYPGEPTQNFAPTLMPDYDTYRNIALHRAVYQSSAFDYNLTGQLVTDGEIAQREPESFIVTQSGNNLTLLDYEKAADGNPYTCIRVMGEEGYFQYQLQNYQQQPDQIVLHSNAHYWSEQATEGFCIEVLASNNGTDWDSIGKYSASKAPDKKIVGPRIPASSNWDREPIGITIRMFDEPINLKCEQPYSFFRVQFNMKGASEWRISEAEFFQEKQLLDMKAAQFYTSAWKSATSADEWLTIDLGSQSEFDQINLHWINKAVNGQILVSDDNKNWKEIVQLPEDEESTNTITCKGKGRYVKIAMNKTANNGPFILSEVEIMGKGGLIAVPAQQPQLRDGTLFFVGRKLETATCFSGT